MNKVFLTVALALWCGSCFAQTLELPEVELISMSDPEYEWMQYDEKEGKALLKKDGIELESKKDNGYAATYCEFSMNPVDTDFVVTFNMKPGSVDNDKAFGIVYDVENDITYKAVVLTKKGFQILSVEDGKASVLRKGIYKVKSKDFNLTMLMKRKKLTFYINGLPLATIKNAEIKNPQFGFVTSNKGKLLCKSFGYKVWYRESEEDTEGL